MHPIPNSDCAAHLLGSFFVVIVLQSLLFVYYCLWQVLELWSAVSCLMMSMLEENRPDLATVQVELKDILDTESIEKISTWAYLQDKVRFIVHTVHLEPHLFKDIFKAGKIEIFCQPFFPSIYYKECSFWLKFARIRLIFICKKMIRFELIL